MTHRISLDAYAADPTQVVRVVEAMTRTLAGLTLEGIEVSLYVHHDQPDETDHEVTR